MKTMHLFAGAGGGLLADIILGHRPVHAVENNPYCCQVLRERQADGTFPELNVIESDVRAVDFRPLAGIDAICAGFPCQDISAAGRGAGLSGERSGLFCEVMRAVNEVRPQWVFLENSPLVRTRGRDVVTRELVARGYRWRDGVLGAADVGAPHKRDRWWCLATLANPDRLRELQSQGCQRDERGRAGDGGWWAAEPAVGRMAHGVANRVERLRALGNAQVPLAAALAWLLLGGPVSNKEVM